jgi:hypothetical protein
MRVGRSAARAIIGWGMTDTHLLSSIEHSAWADLGCDEGTFTIALTDELDRAASFMQSIAIARGSPIVTRCASTSTWGDFTKPGPFGSVDGILMANSLHYVANKKHSCARANRG